ncbi:MAG: hypothetical protein C0603_11550 [Denitrovibrio sp.]|nr:MAG: hypothetical protein C0603_11550 [Denitrovibrio sp.]
MNIRQLEYFYEIVNSGSFSKAAEKLFVAQPAISMSIKQLEEEIGIQLINRLNKGISLTPEGGRIFYHAEKILADMDSLQNEIDDLKGVKTGTIHIGIPEMLGNYYFSLILAEFKQQYPAIKMVIESEPSNSIKAKIASGDIDLGIISTDNISSEYDSHFLFNEEILIGLSIDNPLSKKQSLTLNDIQNEDFLLFGKGNYHLRELLLNLMESSGIEPNIVFESNLTETIKSLTANNIGISAFLKKVIENDKEIVSTKLEPRLFTSIGIAWKKGSYISKANKLFIEFLNKKMGQTKN